MKMKTGLAVKEKLGLTAQAGFIQGAILFGIALLAAVMGGFALLNRTPLGSRDNQQAKLNASVFVKQGYNLRDGTSRYSYDKGSADNMTFDTLSGTGLFDTTKQYAIVQVGPSLSYGGGMATNVAPSDPRAGSYTIHKGITVPEIGTASAEWLGATVFSDSLTCQAINTLIFGSSAPASPPATALTAAQWQSGTGSETLPAGATGWNAGWLESATPDGGGNKYVYFRVVKEG
jgi:hypothetical protein